MDGTALLGGFTDAARQSAEAFRTALDCMARPGRIGRLAGAVPPEGASPAAATLLLVLADADTPVWLPPRLAGGAVAEWLRFHAGAPLVTEPETACFALGRWEELAPLEAWPAGEPAYPDRGATLILEAEALEGGPQWRLTGPGIAGETAFAPVLPEGAAGALRRNAARFPLGLDLFLASGACIAALPRTTRIGG